MKIISSFVLGFVLAVWIFPRPLYSSEMGVPVVFTRVDRGYMFLDVGSTEYKISRVGWFTNILLRYHIPTRTLYVFYQLRPDVKQNVLVTLFSSQPGSNAKVRKGRFFLEPLFPSWEISIGRDRLPIFGSTRLGNVVFSPLTAKLGRLLSGNEKQDDVFTLKEGPDSNQAHTRYIVAGDFVPVQPPPKQEQAAALPTRDTSQEPVLPEQEDDATAPAKEATPPEEVQDDQAASPSLPQKARTAEFESSDTSPVESGQIVMHYGLKKWVVVPEN